MSNAENNRLFDSRPTVMFGAPTMFVDLLQELEKHDNKGLDSLDMLFSGAAIATVDLLNKIKKVLPQATLRVNRLALALPL